ncbi:uncharacterized protein LOC107610644 [Arachis ipaensis]|uniref:uncharacterized protein LOC107610644 n=1 Tax=Arachis ipaensis TaxID=130454 RepID=UPI0007AF462E|nr:uncharacterized protein LOC107610644 [Arachis ipaensis]XP_025673740.1 uncharacterized protein LOC112772932 [Arachis hypogaea]
MSRVEGWKLCSVEVRTQPATVIPLLILPHFAAVVGRSPTLLSSPLIVLGHRLLCSTSLSVFACSSRSSVAVTSFLPLPPFMQIEPESQTKLLDATLNLEGVLLAGVPGAPGTGGFDVVFAVTLGDSSNNVKKIWSLLNVI